MRLSAPKPARGRERHVLPKAAVAVIFAVEANGAKQDRDRRRREGMSFVNRSRPRDDRRVEAPARNREPLPLDVDHGFSARDVGRRNGESVKVRSASMLGVMLAKGIERSTNRSRPAASRIPLSRGGAPGPPLLGAPQEAATDSEHTAHVALNELRELQLRPHVDESLRCAFAFVRIRSEPACVQCADARATKNIEANVAAGRASDFVRDVVDHANFIRTTRRARPQEPARGV